MVKKIRQFLGQKRRALALRQSRYRVKAAIGPSFYKDIQSLRIACFPNHLEPSESVDSYGYAMQKILACLSIRPQPFDPMKPYDLVIDWQDLTQSMIDTAHYAAQAAGNFGQPAPVVLNARCVDISKQAVAAAFETAFGYPVDLDPTKHHGPAVMKSDRNAAHDGQIVQCPLAPKDVRDGYVYSHVINNIHDGLAVDLRLIYIKGVLPVFYRKKRPEKDRFLSMNTHMAVAETAEFFSAEEITMIDQFCASLGADYGELDTLRDKQTGKLYVVDIAKTPFGILYGIKRSERARAMEQISAAFAKRVLAPLITTS